MTLLWPGSAIVAGAIGGSLLVLMYMLRLRRRPVRVSSIAFWGDPPRDLEANVPLRMVRPAWMLLLQALAVALLAIALGRPAVDSGVASSDRLYILIDTSASMGARDGPGGSTRLEEAKRRATTTIEGVGGLAGSRAMLLTFASRPQGVTPMTADRGALSASLRQIEGTDEAGDLNAALDLVGALIASEAGEGTTRAGARVIILSDGAFDRGAGRPLAGASIEFVPIGARTAAVEGRENVAIASLAARRDDRDPSMVRVFARIVSMRREATPLTLRFTIDGQDLARRAATVPGASSTGEPADPDATPEAAATGDPVPGEHSIAIEFDRVDGGVLEVRLDRPDLLEADNRAGVVLPPVQRARVLLVTPDPAEFFLRGVLEELPPAWMRVITPAEYEGAAGDAMLAESDVVVFDRFAPRIAPDRPSISFGAGLPIDGLERAGEEFGGATGATQWDRGDPRLASAWLDSLRVSRTIQLRPPSNTPTRTLVHGREGPLVVERRDGAIRRVVVTFGVADSNWPLSPGLAIFVASAIDDLVYAGVPGQARSWRAGEVIDGRGVDGVGVEGPLEVRGGEGRAVATGMGGVVVPRAGVYTTGAGRSLAVNVADEFESRLGVATSLRIAGEDVRSSAGAAGPSELWFWFVLAAGVVLLVEWAVYLWIARL